MRISFATPNIEISFATPNIVGKLPCEIQTSQNTHILKRSKKKKKWIERDNRKKLYYNLIKFSFMVVSKLPELLENRINLPKIRFKNTYDPYTSRTLNK